MLRLLVVSAAVLFAPAAFAGEFTVVNRCEPAAKFEVVNRCGPAAPAAPAAPATKTDGPQCGCASVGSGCPTPGFCGGAGCQCGKTAAGVAAGPFVNPPAGSFATPATTVPTAATPLPARGPSSVPAPQPVLNYTVVPCAVAVGFTSGCSNGRFPNVRYVR